MSPAKKCSYAYVPPYFHEHQYQNAPGNVRVPPTHPDSDTDSEPPQLVPVNSSPKEMDVVDMAAIEIDDVDGFIDPNTVVRNIFADNASYIIVFILFFLALVIGLGIIIAKFK